MLLRTLYGLGTNFWQTLKGPFSAVSKPLFITKDHSFKINEIYKHKMYIIMLRSKLDMLAEFRQSFLYPNFDDRKVSNTFA